MPLHEQAKALLRQCKALGGLALDTLTLNEVREALTASVKSEGGPEPFGSMVMGLEPRSRGKTCLVIRNRAR